MYSERDLLISEKYIDKKATQANADEKLKSYFRMKRIARRDNAGLSSPSFDGMPKSKPAGNSVERRIVQSIYAKQVVKEIPAAINACDKQSQKVLKMLYFQGKTDVQVQEEIGYSHSRYFDHVKPTALLEFADAYLLDDLKVYNFPNRTITGV